MDEYTRLRTAGVWDFCFQICFRVFFFSFCSFEFVFDSLLMAFLVGSRPFSWAGSGLATCSGVRFAYNVMKQIM
jgi:hypothetical protein